jgi:hypothetical protein
MFIYRILSLQCSQWTFFMQGDGPIGGSIHVRPRLKIDAVAIVLAC